MAFLAEKKRAKMRAKLQIKSKLNYFPLLLLQQIAYLKVCCFLRVYFVYLLGIVHRVYFVFSKLQAKLFIENVVAYSVCIINFLSCLLYFTTKLTCGVLN